MNHPWVASLHHELCDLETEKDIMHRLENYEAPSVLHKELNHLFVSLMSDKLQQEIHMFEDFDKESKGFISRK